MFLFSGMVFCGKEDAQAGWYDGSWTYRKAVTVQSSKVETTETSFPVLVSVTNPDLKSIGNSGHVSQANGYDIIFTDDDGTTLLYFEIESWDDETGEIQAWVETDISTTVDKVIYMYYGNSSATDLSDAEGVWDINFVMVQHLQEDPTDTSPAFIDSTSNNNDGTDYGDMTTGDQVAGQIDGSLDFDGGDDWIILSGIPFADNTLWSISMWVYVEDNTNYNGFFGNTYSVGENTRLMYISSSQLRFHNDVNDFVLIDNEPPLNEWSQLTLICNGADSDNLLWYLNGVYKETVSLADTAVRFKMIGGTGFAWYSFDGIIDEVRISDTDRTAEWIETEYNNQNSPETFLVFGSEERDVYYLMQSANYKIEKDSINFGGTDGSSSDSYLLNDTMGEIGTGFSESDTYQIDAGYRQMSETYLAITSPADVTMSPDIGGVSGGIGEGQAAWTVTTDSSGGYSLDIKASSAPAMQSGANSFADYTLAVSGTPDYAWSVAVADSEFGFTPEGNDIVSKFLDNGAVCNLGSNDTPDQCWSNLSISYENIASSSDPNHPNGTATTVKFQAESGASHSQEEGSYQATVTVTAVAL